MANQPDHWCLRARDSVLPVTPMFHANCWGVPYACAMMGIKMVFPGPHLHPEDLLTLMMEERPTYALGVPTIWLGMAQLLEADPKKWKLPPGIRMLVGGAAMPEALIRTYAKHGAQVTHGWGMTEMSPLGSASYLKPELQNVDERREVPPLRHGGRAGADHGHPPHRQRRQRTALGRKERGRDPGARAFHHRQLPRGGRGPDKFTADGWLRTGDVAAIDAHGYIRIADRTKDLIKSGGEWISSVDMENRLMSHDAVQEAAVIAIADAKWGERPLACVVLKDGRKASAEELRAHLAGAFAKWQLPDRVEFLDAIPRTSTGKFWKVKLREMFR
jgi:fatty-acyl-CoA synthase